MPKFLLFLTILISLKVFSGYYENQDLIIEEYFENLRSCEIELDIISSYPYPYSRIYKKILPVKNISSDEECKNKIEELIYLLENRFLKNRNYIRLQSSTPQIFFNTNSQRYTEDNSLSYSYSDFKDSFSYNFQAILTDGDMRLDGSYFSYFSENNLIFTFGRSSQWWSPSQNMSLILSNQSRPFPFISLENNIPKVIDLRFLRALGPVNYKFFLGQLEEGRTIPNAKLLGLRLTFFPNRDLQWSIFRTAQFGGQGRPTSLRTIFNLLIGRENINTLDSTKNDPGNQIAGIDFSYSLNFKNRANRIYGQIAGEDEAGYLPSRTFYNLGFSTLNKSIDNPFKLSLEMIDTESSSGIDNYTYNHYLYQDGYRYLKKPIGASIDSDSNMILVKIEKNIFNKGYFTLKLFKSDINKNKSYRNSFGPNQLKVNGLEISRRFIFEKYNINLDFIFNDIKNEDSKYDEEKKVIFTLSKKF